MHNLLTSYILELVVNRFAMDATERQALTKRLEKLRDDLKCWDADETSYSLGSPEFLEARHSRKWLTNEIASLEKLLGLKPNE